MEKVLEPEDLVAVLQDEVRNRSELPALGADALAAGVLHGDDGLLSGEAGKNGDGDAAYRRQSQVEHHPHRTGLAIDADPVTLLHPQIQQVLADRMDLEGQILVREAHLVLSAVDRIAQQLSIACTDGVDEVAERVSLHAVHDQTVITLHLGAFLERIQLSLVRSLFPLPLVRHRNLRRSSPSRRL